MLVELGYGLDVVVPALLFSDLLDSLLLVGSLGASEALGEGVAKAQGALSLAVWRVALPLFILNIRVSQERNGILKLLRFLQ